MTMTGPRLPGLLGQMFALALSVLCLIGPATGRAQADPASTTRKTDLKSDINRRFGEVWVKTELYFGLTKVHGGYVTEAEWTNFLDQEITPLFRDGLTVLTGEGQYLMRRSPVLIKEQAKVVVLIHPVGDPYEKALDQIIKKYTDRFDQESVLKISTFVRARF